MITRAQDIRIYDDTGKGESYEVTNIIFENDDTIVAKMNIDYTEPFTVIIDKNTHVVASPRLSYYLAENYVSKIRQYIKDGGQLFNITKIDTIRDGGTISIQTSKHEYFVHQRNNTIHMSYPPCDDNIIKDENHIEYIFDRVEAYIKRMADDVERHNDVLNKMKLQQLYKGLPF